MFRLFDVVGVADDKTWPAQALTQTLTLTLAQAQVLEPNP